LISCCEAQFIEAFTVPINPSISTRGARNLDPKHKAEIVNLIRPYTPSFNIKLASITEPEPDASPWTSGSQT
jgi:hypothetical protein